jgi:hypothetical protein
MELIGGFTFFFPRIIEKQNASLRIMNLEMFFFAGSLDLDRFVRAYRGRLLWFLHLSQIGYVKRYPNFCADP